MTRDIPAGIRQAVHDRDRGACVICGAAATEVMHRIRRREGGHKLSNLALGCRTCHTRCHANPTWAGERGYILSAVAQVDPQAEPILTWRGWLMLWDDGGFTVIAPRTTLRPHKPLPAPFDASDGESDPSAL